MMPVDLETAEWWKDQADEARAERDHLALRLEEVKAEAQNQREHANKLMAELEDLRDRLAGAGAKLAELQGRTNQAEALYNSTRAELEKAQANAELAARTARHEQEQEDTAATRELIESVFESATSDLVIAGSIVGRKRLRLATKMLTRVRDSLMAAFDEQVF